MTTHGRDLIRRRKTSAAGVRALSAQRQSENKRETNKTSNDQAAHIAISPEMRTIRYYFRHRNHAPGGNIGGQPHC
jgi:hypothetical protein